MKIKVNKIKLIEKATCKFCVISDIHHIKSCTQKYYNRLIKVVRKEAPQYILIPGDLVDNIKILTTEYYQDLIYFIKQLALIAPVIISKGNHDLDSKKYNSQKLDKILDNIDNVYYLNNKSIILGDYQFIGFSPSVKAYLSKYKDIWRKTFIQEFKNCHFKIANNKKVILLCHSPEIVSDITLQEDIPQLKKVNYIISGHMHNGLVPAIFDKAFKHRGLFGPNYTIFPSYCRGVHTLGDTKLVICKSVRSLTKDSLLFKMGNAFYVQNITILELCRFVKQK